MATLILIPARKGSKRLPGKNTKLLGGQPLVAYTLSFASTIRKDGDEICVSTDDDDVMKVASAFNLNVPFIRPAELSSDLAGTYEVIIHALNHYEERGKNFDYVLLLQPTSPFRSQTDLKQLYSQMRPGADMVVTVSRSKDNPYFTLFEENEAGWLERSKMGAEPVVRSQDCPVVYAYNGSMYLIRVSSLRISNINAFRNIVKSEMPEERSVDIDTMKDWIVAEYFLTDFIATQNNENSQDYSKA